MIITVDSREKFKDYFNVYFRSQHTLEHMKNVFNWEKCENTWKQFGCCNGLTVLLIEKDDKQNSNAQGDLEGHIPV